MFGFVGSLPLVANVAVVVPLWGGESLPQPTLLTRVLPEASRCLLGGAREAGRGEGILHPTLKAVVGFLLFFFFF